MKNKIQSMREFSVEMLRSSRLFVLCLTFLPFIVSGQSMVAYGDLVKDEITKKTDTKSFSFYGKEGDIVMINLSRPSGELWPRIEVYDPAMRLLAVNDGPREARIDNLIIRKTGKYMIIVKDGYDGKSYGTFGMTIQNLKVPGKQTVIKYGTVMDDSIEFAGFVRTYTFTGTRSDEVLFQTLGRSGDLWHQAEIYSPAGKLLKCTYDQHSAMISLKSLPETGTYTILFLDGYDGTLTGNYTILLNVAQDWDTQAEMRSIFVK
jgi:hypothetical protein